MSVKYDLSRKVVSEWSYPVLARSLDDIRIHIPHTIFSCFDDQANLISVQVDLEDLWSQEEGVDVPSTTCCKLLDLLKDTEADPADIQTMIEVFKELFNDDATILEIYA